MNERWRKILRTAQTCFPWVADAKYEVQRAVRRLRRRPFEDDFQALRLLDLGAAPVLVDVGANRGQSIDAFRLMVPGAHIIAFEPNPLLADRLRRRYSGQRNVDIHSAGLSECPGQLALSVPLYNGYPFDGLASFDEASAETWLESRIMGYDPAKLRIAKFTCNVRRLDEFRIDPALIKVDVQGFERQMLLGARETLLRANPVLLIEGPDHLTVEYLKEIGYRPFAFREGRLVPDETGELNTFFQASAGPGVIGASTPRAPR